MDVRGRGLSDWSNSPETYNPAVYAADLAGWCAALGLERILVIGTSMGGLIAMSTAGLFPDLVAGAVLNDVGPVVEASGLARISGYAGGAAAPIGDWKAAAAYARRTNGLAFPAYGERDWERFARRIFRQTPEGLVLDYDPAIGRPLSDAAQPVPAPDLWPLFERLAEGRPLGLIRGETSDILGAGTAAEMARRAPHMRTAQVAGVGHAPMLDEPEALALIAAFLETAP
jgi:pimeloyl-ACP methyl ester carboxylesterase